MLRVVVILVTLALGAPAAAADSEALRRNIEQLLESSASEPTGAGNRGPRAETVWQWANALAIDGTPLPVNLTQVATFIMRKPDAGPPFFDALLDAYIQELALLEREPEALGRLRADTGPFTARSHATIEQVYTVGTREIHPGGGLLLARHFMANFGVWQTDRPEAPNYISIRSSNETVSFEAGRTPVFGMHGGFRGAVPGLVFRVAGGVLKPGDEVTIAYGDTASGSPGLMMPSFSSDRMPLPVYVAFEEDGHFHTLPIQPISVRGGAFASVHGFAPSVVAPGEAFSLTVRAQDRYYNRATGDLPGWQVLNGDSVLAEIPAGSTAYHVVDNIRLNAAGVHRLRVASADGRITGDINPIVVLPDVEQRVYWGDTHGHSGFAEGIGTAERFMTWAKEDARLDYVTHSEHDIWMDDFEWEVLRQNVARHSDDGFAAFLGYEWTVDNVDGGHHNVLYRTAEGRRRIGSQHFPTLSRLYEGLRATAKPEDVIIIPHAHQAGDYRQSDPELEPLIEIMSMHGNFEWFGRMYLQHGHQVGFTAASDNHLSQPGHSLPLGGSLSQRGGLGAVRAPSGSRDDLFDAMRNLSTYATTGDRMILEFSVNGSVMGSRAPMAETRTIEGRVIGTAPIRNITVFRNDSVLWTQDYATPSRRLRGAEAVTLTFNSSATPHQPGDNPRGWRTWRGRITASDAIIASATIPPSHSPDLSGVRVEEGTVEFTTFSRGRGSSLHLQLEGIQRDAALNLELEPASEFGGAPPIYRPPAPIPAFSTTLNLGDAIPQPLHVDAAAQDYTDRITLRVLEDTGPMEARFEVRDERSRQGDYYFVRVTQENDAMAWSSPVWVGGYPTR